MPPPTDSTDPADHPLGDQRQLRESSRYPAMRAFAAEFLRQSSTTPPSGSLPLLLASKAAAWNSIVENRGLHALLGLSPNAMVLGPVADGVPGVSFETAAALWASAITDGRLYAFLMTDAGHEVLGLLLNLLTLWEQGGAHSPTSYCIYITDSAGKILRAKTRFEMVSDVERLFRELRVMDTAVAESAKGLALYKDLSSCRPLPEPYVARFDRT